MVDGYAVVNDDLKYGASELAVFEEVTAGKVPTLAISSGQATRIMTGAPIPDGAEAVVMVERTAFAPRCLRLVTGDNDSVSAEDSPPLLGTVHIQDTSFKPGQNIMRRGTSIRRGDIVVPRGREIRAIDVGVLSEVGRTEVLAIGRPSVAVLATGNELVPASQKPAAGQIRNSNSPMLVALAERTGAASVDLGIARDEQEQLRELISRGLAHDVLVMSGGVSAGVLDLVPSVLSELGVQEVFHKVQLKPGKPLWFGVKAAGDHQVLVFGLPGNPVSSLVCFELFVRPAIDRLAGRPDKGATASQDGASPLTATLSAPFDHRGDRPTYQPAVLGSNADGAIVMPLRWKGSADLRTLSEANCLALFPAGDRTYSPGERVSIVMLH
jgi:molybdopterin molybdotransferase